MKPIKKIILTGLFSCILSSATFPCVAKTPELYATEITNQISPRADNLEWRFKIINGLLHRRLYNATRNIWVGDWEPVN